MTEWNLPPELAQQLPRAAGPTTSTKVSLILTPLFPLFYVFLIFSICISHDHELDILKQRGIPTQAMITALNEYHGKNSSWAATYSFEAAAVPTKYLIHEAISWQEFRSLGVGASIPILYDPEDPHIAGINFNDRIHTQNPYQDMIRLISFMMAFLIPFSFLLTLFVYYRYRKEKYLLQWGHAVQANIISEKEIRSGKVRCTEITYKFMDAKGVEIQSKRNDLPIKGDIRSEKTRKFFDAVVTNPTVLFDEKNSSKNILYPSRLAVCLSPVKSNPFLR